MKVATNGLKPGIRFFLIHFCVELICFTTLRHYYTIELAGIIALAFDIFAFVPQGLFGEFMDKRRALPMGSIGVLLMGLGVFVTTLANSALLMAGIIIMALGNAILHEQGALETVAKGEGKIFPVALFVSGGSFGLVLGQTLGRFGVSLLWMVLPLLIIELLLLTSGGIDADTKYPLYDCVKFRDVNIRSYQFPIGLIIIVAFIVTSVRSFIGYAIPISWKKELWQEFLLFFVMGIGKALGGYLADSFGARKVGVLSTVLAIPFLVFGSNHMVISVIGICLFSMTMSITFEMILSVLPQNPGISFGMTTIALFIGITPVFFVSFTNSVNIALVVILSLICAVLLHFFCNDKTNKKSSLQ